AALERRGHALLEANCSRCHAIERTGDSPHREAPPFRTLSRRYPVDWLQEALAEGLSTGHPDMPEFVFEVPEIDAILAYLQSIQVKTEGPTHRCSRDEALRVAISGHPHVLGICACRRRRPRRAARAPMVLKLPRRRR